MERNIGSTTERNIFTGLLTELKGALERPD
jgi:hypothetical protein